jgi:Ca2+-dependent lipid-binding protein
MKILKAKLIHDVETLGKMDPYCVIEYKGTKEVKTSTQDDAGKDPVWN